jgi:hypothetical protein
MSVKGYIKNYKKCIRCNEMLPWNQKHYSRSDLKTNFNSDCRCRKCKIDAVEEDNWSDGKLKCHFCGTFQDIDQFCIDPSNKQKYRDYRHRKCHSCKRIHDKTNRIYRYGGDKITHIIRNRWDAANARSRKHNLEFNITMDDIYNMIVKQDFKCNLTKIDLTFEMGSGRVQTNMSLDKINPNLGYTKDNIQIVCAAVNMMKSNLSNDELYNFCEKILENKR